MGKKNSSATESDRSSSRRVSQIPLLTALDPDSELTRSCDERFDRAVLKGSISASTAASFKGKPLLNKLQIVSLLDN